MHKQAQTALVHLLGFGKGQTLAHEAREPLSSSVIPALDVRRLPRLFAARGVLSGRNDLAVGFPAIGVALPRLICCRDRCPQRTARFFAAVAQGVAHDLARGRAQRDPHPTLGGAAAHERPPFIEFQDRGGRHAPLRRAQCGAQRRQRQGFF